MSTPKITGEFPKSKHITRHQLKSKASSTVVAAVGTSQNDDLETLRQFDLNWKYGPCSGISRLDRWNRADKLSLNPPDIVKAIITRHPNNNLYTQSVWYDYEL